MAYTRSEVEQMYNEWFVSRSDKEFKDYWELSLDEMKQINELTNGSRAGKSE